MSRVSIVAIAVIALTESVIFATAHDLIAEFRAAGVGSVAGDVVSSSSSASRSRKPVA
jgi:hypothetical protein